MLQKSLSQNLFISLILVCSMASAAPAQTTAFTYQGKLSTSGTPATGTYEMQFKLFDALSDGTQVGATITNTSVAVAAGIFTIELDFAAGAFDGTPRYLEICVRPAGSPDPYTVLAPRQAITSTPYALRSANAAAADGLSAACAGCVTDSHIATVDGSKLTGNVAGSQISGEIPTASVPIGSGNYIQNSAAALKAGKTSLQQAAGFDIDGDGIIGGNLVVNGGVGIGTATPQATFHVNGSSWFQGDTTPLPASAGKGIVVGFSGDFGYISAFDYGTFIPKNLLLNPGGGNVGIGTTTPQSKLSVQSGGYGLTHTNGTVTLGTFITTAAGGSGWLGTKSNHPLNFFTNDGLAQMTLDTNGNVGIGTTSPATKLFVLSSTPGLSAVYGESATGRGVWGKSTSSRGVYGESTSLEGVFGISSSGTGVLGASTSGSGVYGNSASLTGFGGHFSNTGGGKALKVDGTGSMGVLEITGGSDLAEHFEIGDGGKPGLVVAIDPQHTGRLSIAHGAYNRRVAGVISGANNLSAGMVLPDVKQSKKSMPIALSGRVWVYCDATRQAIRPGDLLTSSNTAGHAMKVVNYTRARGAIIGKAMTGLNAGRGLVLVLVSLQ